MPDYFPTQIAETIVAAAADFIRLGRTIPSTKIEGRRDMVLASQQPYDEAIATIPRAVAFLDSMSLENRIASLLNMFHADPQYESAWRLTQRAAFYSPITLAFCIEYAWRERVAKTW
jgi:hypothetical protein